MHLMPSPGSGTEPGKQPHKREQKGDAMDKSQIPNHSALGMSLLLLAIPLMVGFFLLFAPKNKSGTF